MSNDGGDEAKVRDGDIVALMKELEPFNRGSVLAGLSRAYAAGKADGAREEREAWTPLWEALAEQRGEISEAAEVDAAWEIVDNAIDAIARRGSEG